MDYDRSAAAPGAEFVKAWTDMMGRMAMAPMAFSTGSTPPEAAREMRSALLSAWSEYFDRFFRSSDFLDLMRQSFSGNVEIRRQLNDFLGELRHTFQGPSRQDVDQLMLAIRHLEERIVDDLDRISARLEDLDSRLGALEPASPEGNGSASQERAAREPRRRGAGMHRPGRP
jgi:hypothetical protein